LSLAPERPPEPPRAQLQQRAGATRAEFELFVDHVTADVSDLLGGRRLTLPLDTLSPHVVIRQRGHAWPSLAGLVAALTLVFVPGFGPMWSAAALLAGLTGWWFTRRQYIVFPGEIADLELFRDRPDAAAARRFVAQVVARIEALATEAREQERQLVGQKGLDRVDELLKFRELYAEGIIDKGDLRLAAETLARREHGRIGFHRD
jgi:hypothetical protein